MGYLHIDNLYKNQQILLFKECYALEKIHGTSAHITFRPVRVSISDPAYEEEKWEQKVDLKFFSGGESHERFVKLFPQEHLAAQFLTLGITDKDVTVFGEAYGGKQQGMSHTYGKELKFVAFDVQVGDNWLDVPNAEQVCKTLGIEFVHYTRIPTDLASLDAARDADSEQAIRNGVGAGKKMEGVILRPIIEVTLNNGKRIIAKHKRDEFRETATPRKVIDPAQLQVLADAEQVANEWVTPMRLEHVLQKIPDHAMEKIPDIIRAMVEDVLREGDKEIVNSEAAKKAIGKRTVFLYKERLKNELSKNS